MKGMMGGAALLAAMMALTPPQLEAQRGARGQRDMMMNRRANPGVEHVMRLRDQLELTEDQIARLEAIRGEVVQHRVSHQAQAEELRSQVMAGQLDAAEAREQAQARREQGEAFAEDVRARVEAILSDDQRAELEDVVGRLRAFERGRASAMRGGQRGFRAGRGAMRGGQRGFGRRGGDRRGPRGMWGPGQRRMMRGPGGGPGFGLDGFGPPDEVELLGGPGLPDGVELEKELPPLPVA